MLKSIEEIELEAGPHVSPEDGMCAMEAAAYLAGERHSDHPQCVCPVIAAYIRTWNDRVPDDVRQELVKPLVPRVIGTRSTLAVQDRRAVLIADWCQRVVLPLWCDLVPSLHSAAAELRALPEASTIEQLTHENRVAVVNNASQSCCDAARSVAQKPASNVAWDAAGDITGNAAWDATRDAQNAARTARAARNAAQLVAAHVAQLAAWYAALAAVQAAAQDAVVQAKAQIWRATPAMIERLTKETEKT